jgi:4-amino-4-deoxy-L-arabinose transferase-like glycosyltransferase
MKYSIQRFLKDYTKLRWLATLSGLILIFVGQSQIAKNVIPESPPIKLGIWINENIHLNIPSVDNILNGLPLLIIGLIVFFISLRGAKFLSRENIPTSIVHQTTPFLRSNWQWFIGGLTIFFLLLWQIQVREYKPNMIVQWIVVLIIFLIILGAWDRHRKINLSPNISRKDILWMLGLFTLGLLVGVYRLQGLPDMLIGDEGAFYTIARDIATGDFNPSIFSSGVYTFPVLSSIGQGLVMRVFGISLWGWRFSSLIAGTLAVFPVYLLGRDLYNRNIAIFSCLALVFSPYFLAFTRMGYNNIQSLFITALTLYWLYIGIQRSSYCYLLLAGYAGGMGFYTYFAARMAIVIAIIFLVLLWILKKIKLRQAFIFLLIVVFGALLTIGPYMAHGMVNDAQGLSYKVFESAFFNVFNGLQFYSQDELTSIAPVFKIGGNELFFNPQIYLVLIARGILRTLLIFHKPWLISEHFIASPLAGTIGVIFYLIGLVFLFVRAREPRHLLLISWFLVTIFGLSILNTVPPRHTHMVSIIPLLALLIGIGISLTASALSTIMRDRQRIQTWIAGVLTLFVVGGGVYDYFIQMPRDYHPFSDQIIAWAAIYAQDEKFLYIYSTEDEINFNRPLLLTEFYPDLSYQPVLLEDFLHTPGDYIDSSEALVFYLPEISDEVEAALATTWGNERVVRDFYNPDGIPVLSSGMNTPFVFERDRAFLQVVQESYRRTPLLLFIGILLVLIGAIALIPSTWVTRLPNSLKRITNWIDFPVQTRDTPDQPLILPGPEHQPEPQIEDPDPPEWALKVKPSKQKTRAGRFQLSTKQVKTRLGHDLYLYLHIPRINFPRKAKAGKRTVIFPDLHFPLPILLLGAVCLAVLGQIFISQQGFAIGSILYILGAICLITWSYLNPKWKNFFQNQLLPPRRIEILLGILLLCAVLFTRFYDLGYRVYGLEADETKWTAQSWYSAILQVDQGEFGPRHYPYQPVDFLVRSMFLKVFGLNFLSARIDSAVLSVLALVFLYFLVRRLANPSTALVSTALYAFSFVALNASHQALHNTTFEVWIMAGLFFLIAALQDKKWWLFQLSGLILAVGMLTYETFFPTVAVAVIYLLWTAIQQIRHKESNLRLWAPQIVLFLWPILVAYFAFTQPYLATRQEYHFGWLNTYSQGGTSILGVLIFILKNIKELLLTVFHGIVWSDSLLRWEGTFIDVLLLPFVLLGFTQTVLNLRNRCLGFVLVWYFLNVLVAPILLGSVWPRVLFTSLAPLMIWGAMGLWIFLAAIRAWIDKPGFKPSIVVFTVVLLAIFSNDYRIFTQGIDDPTDRVIRRELSDLTMEFSSGSDFLLYPYMPTQNDAVEMESHVILFSVAGSRDLGLEAQDEYRQIPFDQLMLAIWENRAEPGVDIFYDKSSQTMQDERTRYLNTMLACYPGVILSSQRQFFDVYHLDAKTLSSPACYQSIPPIPQKPADGSVFSSGQSIHLTWDAGEIESTGFTVIVEQRNPGIIWLEAEAEFPTQGWYGASEFVTDFTGAGFLLDNWDSGVATYDQTVTPGEEYRIWIRSYKRRYNDQHNFVVINGEPFYFAGGDIALNQWVWESIGVFRMPGDNLSIGLGREYGQEEMFSVFIDSILITPDISSRPEGVHVWEQVMTIREVQSTGSETWIEEGLTPGAYRWSVRVFDGDRLVDSGGNPGNPMPYATFSIAP